VLWTHPSPHESVWLPWLDTQQVGCYLARGLVVFKDTLKDNRPFVFWDAIGNVFWAWSAQCLNEKGCLNFL
jgi:hypothetical protein